MRFRNCSSSLSARSSKILAPRCWNSWRHFVSWFGCTLYRRATSATSFLWMDSTTTRNLNSALCLFGVLLMRSSLLLVSDLTPLLVYHSGLRSRAAKLVLIGGFHV